ncbi:MAG: alpha/beta-hydrolase family protein [Actinomycetota bacterium]
MNERIGLAKRVQHALGGIAGRSEQVGMFVAAASVPRSLQRTLMKRSTSDQAVITGAVMAINYGLATLVHDSIEALTQWRAGGGEFEDRGWRGRTAAADAAAMVAGFALQTAFQQRSGERLSRGGLRTTGYFLSVAGFAGTATAAIQEGMQLLDERTDNRWKFRSLPFAIVAGAGFSLVQQRGLLRRYGNEDRLLFEEQGQVSSAQALVTGALVSTGLALISAAERKLAASTSETLAHFFPGKERGWRTPGHLLSLALMGTGVSAGLHHVHRRVESVASKAEPGLEKQPSSEYVSGGMGSHVQYDALSRQGQRHVNTFIRPEWIEQTMGEPAKSHPIRIFVGLDCAPSEEERVALALKELDRTNAFNREVLLVVSPTGTGYVNYQAVESLEYLTRGDCATVTLQYSKRPSPLSLGRVEVGRKQNEMLFLSLWERFERMESSERPRLVVFGESLGAHTSQDAFVHRGTRGLQDRGIDSALWIGTPFASEWKSEVLGRPRHDTDTALIGQFNAVSDIEQLENERAGQLRYVMLTHNNDAVAYFGLDLFLACPPWLGPPETRPEGVPKSARYGPVITFLQTLVDMKNSMTVVPGVFEAKGHDYRADLARFVRAVYRLDATEEQMERIEEALRAFETRRAEWIEKHKKGAHKPA